MSGANISDPAAAAGTTDAVDRLMARRTAPGDVALLAVGGGDAPDVVGVAGELASRGSDRTPCARGSPSPSSRTSRYWSSRSRRPRKSTQACEILVHEQRIRRADEGVLLELHDRTRPRTPGRGRNRMRRRPDPEQVQDHQLAVVIPARLAESPIRASTRATAARLAVEHPGEIDAAIDRVGSRGRSPHRPRSIGAR